MSSDPAKLVTREVLGPDKNLLTESDVLRLLGDVTSRTLRRWIRERRFPRSFRTVDGRRWKWSDVVWFHLGLELCDRFGEADDDDDENGPADPPSVAEVTTPPERSPAGKKPRADG